MKSLRQVDDVKGFCKSVEGRLQNVPDAVLIKSGLYEKLSVGFGKGVASGIRLRKVAPINIQ